MVAGPELLEAVIADLRRSRLPRRLLTMLALEVSAEPARTGAWILESAEGLADRMVATRSGHDPMEGDDWAALEDLRRRLPGTRSAAVVLDRALRSLPAPASAVAARIDDVVTRLATALLELSGLDPARCRSTSAGCPGCCPGCRRPR